MTLNKTLNLRHLRVGPTILHSLQHEQYAGLEELWLGPIFSSTVTIASLVASLTAAATTSPRLAKLDLDLTRIAERRTSCGSSGSSGSGSGHPDFCWEDEMRCLIQGLPSCLHHLSLRFSNGDIGIQALAAALPRHNKGLISLDLRSNRMSDDGAVALAHALRQAPLHKSLQSLIVSWNDIGSSGAIALAQALPYTQLKRLDLSCNKSIDDMAVQALCAALTTNVHLQDLNLFQCSNITEIGVKSLLTVLEEHNDILENIHLKPKRPIRHDPRAAVAAMRSTYDSTTTHQPSSTSTSTITTTSTTSRNDNNNDDKKRKETLDMLLVKLEHWLLLNRSGRQFLRASNQTDIAIGLWPFLLAKSTISSSNVRSSTAANPNVIYFILQQKPDLACYGGIKDPGQIIVEKG